MHFTQAIARLPAATCGAGQTTAQLGAPDIATTSHQFLAYVETLLQLGLKVTVLPRRQIILMRTLLKIPPWSCRNWR